MPRSVYIPLTRDEFGKTVRAQAKGFGQLYDLDHLDEDYRSYRNAARIFDVSSDLPPCRPIVNANGVGNVTVRIHAPGKSRVAPQL